jgi:hypothetical protein
MRTTRIRSLICYARRERHNRIFQVGRLQLERDARNRMPQRHGCLTQSEAILLGQEGAVVGVGGELDEPFEQFQDFRLFAPDQLVGRGVNPGLPVLFALEILLVENRLEGAVVAGIKTDLIDQPIGFLGQSRSLFIQIIQVNERRSGSYFDCSKITEIALGIMYT